MARLPLVRPPYTKPKDSPIRQRIALISLSVLLSILAVVCVGLALPTPAPSPTKGCERYPLFRTVWVCGGSVFLFAAGQMQFMGNVRDLAPMPEPRH